MENNVLGIKLFSVKEASEDLDIPPKGIKRYIREGQIVGTKIGTSWFVPEPSLKAFKAVMGERQRVRDEALRLKGILDEFLERGDISQSHHGQAIKTLSDLL